MADRKYERTYDGETWKDVPESSVREVLAGAYINVEIVMDEIHKGQEIPTNFAIYREKKEE
jgi:hypothetical protein